jgi:hypothetical protein
MGEEKIVRKDLDSQQFKRLRQNTERITQLLERRLNSHLDTLKSLFIPRRLLGTYIKSSATDDVPGSDKAFAELQEKFRAICEKPFRLPKKLHTPLPPISTQLDAVPFKYSLKLGDSQKRTTITAANRWVVSYRSECTYERLKAMVTGVENPQPDDMKQSLIDHLTLGIFLKRFPALSQLLRDLRYEVEIRNLDDLGGLPVVLLRVPLESFLPSDDFILEVTQLSGIPAFQEIVAEDAPEGLPDPLKDTLKASGDD